MEGPRIVNRGHTTNMPTGVSETKGTMYGPATMDLRDRVSNLNYAPTLRLEVVHLMRHYRHS